MQQLTPKFLGLFFIAFIALMSVVFQYLPIWPFTINGHHPIEAVLIAIVIGILLNNLIKIPEFIRQGSEIAIKIILPIAIVLLGARLNAQSLSEVSFNVIAINLTCVVLTFFVTFWISRRVGLSANVAILIAIGTSICGSAAILVAAPIIMAESSETATSVTVINVFGLIALFVFPALGHMLGMGQESFGIWAGSSIQAVPQAIAAGMAYGTTAGDIGTVTKLMRVLFLAPMIILLSIWQTKRSHHRVETKTPLTSFVPPFIIGFIIMIVLNSVGWLPTFTIGNLSFNTPSIFVKLSNFFLTMALAAIGMKVNLRKMINSGGLPLVMSGVASVFIASLSLLMITLLL